jgi:hypothetical protein
LHSFSSPLFARIKVRPNHKNEVPTAVVEVALIFLQVGVMSSEFLQVGVINKAVPPVVVVIKAVLLVVLMLGVVVPDAGVDAEVETRIVANEHGPLQHDQQRQQYPSRKSGLSCLLV